MDVPLSDDDLQRALGIRSDVIVKYSELKDYSTLEDLIGNVGNFRIILIEDKYNSGHWVAIARGTTHYYFFNSYGVKPDGDWKWVPRMTRLILGEGTNELTRLLKDVPHEYNKMKLQGSKSQTCGRWCVLFCILCGKMLYSMTEFNTYLKDRKKESPKKSYDQLILELTSNF